MTEEPNSRQDRDSTRSDTGGNDMKQCSKNPPSAQLRKPLTIIGFILLIALVWAAPSQGDGGVADLIIVHTNDFHGALLPRQDKTVGDTPEMVGGAAYLAGEIDKLRAQYPGEVLLVDCGDIAQGTPLSNIFGGEPVVRYMNHIRYDVMALGNHEFDWGQANLKKMLIKAQFPIICANIIDESTGKLPSFVKPHVIIERNGIKAGLIGVLSPHTPSMCNPKNIKGLKFIEPQKPIMQSMKELRAKGAKVILLVSHLGIEEDRKLPLEIPGITAIIGGHSHTSLKTPEKVKGTVIVQAGCNGKFLGNLHLRIKKETGELISYNVEHELITIINRNITPDSKVEEMLKPYRANVDPIMNQTIATATDDILNKPPEGYGDTPLGNLVTDAVRQTYDAELVIYNTEGIRAPILKGAVTKGAVYTMLPFDNAVVNIDLPGDVIIDVLEYYCANPKCAQVSGATFTYYPKREKGHRIENLLINGKPLDKKKDYKFATVDFLYFTSGDLEALKKGTNFVCADLSRDVVEAWIKKTGTITPSQDRRIVLIKEQ